MMMIDLTLITYGIGILASGYLVALQQWWIRRMRGAEQKVHPMFWYTHGIIGGLLWGFIVVFTARFLHVTDPCGRDEFISGWIWITRMWPVIIAVMAMAIHGSYRTFMRK